MPDDDIYSGVRFLKGLDLGRETTDGYLGLKHITAHGRVDLRNAAIGGNASLDGATLTEDLYGWAIDVDGLLQLRDMTVHDDVDLRSGSAQRLRAPGLTVDGELDLEGFDASVYELKDADIGKLRIARSDAELDLRGADVDELWLDDLTGYDIRVDDETRIEEVTVGYGRDVPSLGDREEELLEKIVEREQPWIDRDGCTFRYSELAKDTCMDDIYNGALGSLVANDVVHELDDGRYLARSDPLYR